LHQRAVEVSVFDQQLRDLVQDLYDTMDQAPGVGLAAPQIGVSLRVLVYSYPDDEDNPRRGVLSTQQFHTAPSPQALLTMNSKAKVAFRYPVRDLPSKEAKAQLLKAWI